MQKLKHGGRKSALPPTALYTCKETLLHEDVAHCGCTPRLELQKMVISIMMEICAAEIACRDMCPIVNALQFVHTRYCVLHVYMSVPQKKLHGTVLLAETRQATRLKKKDRCPTLLHQSVCNPS